MSNEIQKDDVTLPGGLGEAKIHNTGEKAKIIGSHSNDGVITLTLAQVVDNYLNGSSITEDADFEIIEPKQLKP